MRKKTGRSAKKPGLPPGSLLHIGQQKLSTAKITMFSYTPAEALEKELHSPEELAAFGSTGAINWIRVTGLHDTGLIEGLCTAFGVHPLVQEDILNTEQRPKLEDYGDYLFVALKALWVETESEELTGEQISLIIGSSYVISFQESDYDLFEPVRARLSSGKGRIRKEGSDYLAYALVDTVVDNYFNALEALGEKIEALEEVLVVQPGADDLQQIHYLKREMLRFRKALWPLREIIGCLSRGESALVKDSTLLYIRDVYDHTIQVIDTLETYRDIVSGMLDIYLSSVSNRMNQIMKVLTIISTIFIPLTFVVGVYGMNFKSMPELDWEWGYPAVWILMIVIFLFELKFFRRRKWL
ncbi:MAG: magnesium/cobalt transporter CorA [Negativicutes bacterium]|nr:magnesium/cobalt transporter CorA [Negativicutes bacterium]